jgi:hypothetical protein
MEKREKVEVKNRGGRMVRSCKKGEGRKKKVESFLKQYI